MKPHLPLLFRNLLCSTLVLSCAGAFAYSSAILLDFQLENVEEQETTASEQALASSTSSTIRTLSTSNTAQHISAPCQATASSEPAAPCQATASSEPAAPPSLASATTGISAAVQKTSLPNSPTPLVVDTPSPGSNSAPLLLASTKYPNGDYTHNETSCDSLTADKTWQGYETVHFEKNPNQAIRTNGRTASFSNCGEVIFSNNKSNSSRYSGGAIGGNTTISDCDTVTFTDNRSASHGGAIYGNTTISDCGTVTFNNNLSTSQGGAIFGVVTINRCPTVTFSGNRTQSNSNPGGAIQGDTTISNCSTVTFTGNQAKSGGAIYKATTAISKCTFVTFSNNQSTERGGAIYAFDSSDTANKTTISDCTSVTFSGNRSGSFGGGAIHGSRYGTIIRDCTAVTFTGNQADGDYGYGGAIYGNTTISDCTAITFRGNRSYLQGGAIYAADESVIIIRGATTFEKNAEVKAGTYRLRSIYQHTGGTLELSAATDKSIDFYDSIYSDANTVIFNQDYEKSDGSTQAAHGTIRFSGRSTAADLEEIKGSAGTATEITDSRTSTIQGKVQLYGGTLSIEDEVILNTGGLDAGAGSTVSISSATLNTEDLSLEEGAQFRTQGTSSLSFNTLTLHQAIVNSGSLTLTGTIDASALALQSELRTYIDFEGHTAENGFTKTSYNAVVVVKGGQCSGGTVTHADLAEGQTLVLSADGIAATASDDIDYSSYHQSNGSVSMSAIRTASGAVCDTITMEGGTLVLDGGALDADVSLAQNAALAFGSDAGNIKGTLIATSEEGTALTTGAASYDTTTETATLAGTAEQALRLDGVRVNMAAGTTLCLRDVVLAAGATLTDDSAWLLAENLTVEVSTVNATLSEAQLMTATSITLSGHGVEAANTQQTPAGSTLRTITLNNISDFAITGSNLCIDLSAYTQLADATDSDYLAILFAAATPDLSTLTITTTLNGQMLTAYYDSTQPQGVAYFDLRSMSVPEPASSTLALLALATLVTRRRRH